MATQQHSFGGVFISDYNIVASMMFGNEIEQVGFIENGERNFTMLEVHESPREKLVMMGDELCINATLSYAKSIGKRQGTLLLQNGNEVMFDNRGKTTITVQMPFNTAGTMFNPTKYGTKYVLFDSIGYEVGMKPNEAKRRLDQLPKLCKKFNLPAFGFVAQETPNCIHPIVYVAKTGTTIYETACGSGSVANYIARYSENFIDVVYVKQPTGEFIIIRRLKSNSSIFEISANVEQIFIKQG